MFRRRCDARPHFFFEWLEDKTTQRAARSISENKDAVVEAGVTDLAKDATPGR